MAFTDPQSITVNAVAQSMPLVSRESLSAFYANSDQSFGLSIRHTPFRKDRKARVRSLVVFTQRKVVPDALTSVNDYETCPVSIQIDRPEAGFSSTEIDYLVQGLKGFLTTANVTKIVGRES